MRAAAARAAAAAAALLAARATPTPLVADAAAAALAPLPRRRAHAWPLLAGSGAALSRGVASISGSLEAATATAPATSTAATSAAAAGPLPARPPPLRPVPAAELPSLLPHAHTISGYRHRSFESRGMRVRTSAEPRADAELAAAVAAADDDWPGAATRAAARPRLPAPPPLEPPPPPESRPPSASYVETVYPFSTSRALREQYERFETGRVRLGLLLEDLDALAGDVMALHCGAPPGAAAERGAEAREGEGEEGGVVEGEAENSRESRARCKAKDVAERTSPANSAPLQPVYVSIYTSACMCAYVSMYT